MKEVKAYKCECGKLYKQKNQCEKHEKKCWSNRENKSCKSCAYWSKPSQECTNSQQLTNTLVFETKDGKVKMYRDCSGWSEEID